jgi:hypothetical protein
MFMAEHLHGIVVAQLQIPPARLAFIALHTFQDPCSVSHVGIMMIGIAPPGSKNGFSRQLNIRRHTVVPLYNGAYCLMLSS